MSSDIERRIASQYFRAPYGHMDLGWTVDAYWGLVTQKVLLPAALKIHQHLVEKKISEKNKHSFQCFDGKIFYIPVSPGRKVFVHTTQSQDFLFVIQTGHVGRLDIRRIFPILTKKENEYTYGKVVSGKMTVKKALGMAEELTGFSDDHLKWASSRPSLEAYRRVKFRIPHVSQKDHMKEILFYGDARDPGYVLSYSFYEADARDPVVHNSMRVHEDIHHQVNVYLPSIAQDLGIKIPRLDKE